MPPCGYRPLAVEGLRLFLRDNLDFFVDLYSARDLSVELALRKEALEIEKIKEGIRGGPWSARVVEINEYFYRRLAAANLTDWNDVREVGESIIQNAVEEIESLLEPSYR